MSVFFLIIRPVVLFPALSFPLCRPNHRIDETSLKNIIYTVAAAAHFAAVVVLNSINMNDDF